MHAARSFSPPPALCDSSTSGGSVAASGELWDGPVSAGRARMALSASSGQLIRAANTASTSQAVGASYSFACSASCLKNAMA